MMMALPSCISLADFRSHLSKPIPVSACAGTTCAKQLIHEDIRDGSNVQELAQLEVLSRLLSSQAGQVTPYPTLATHIRVSVDTIRRWLDTLESFYFCFRIRPWSANIASSLLK